VLCFPIVWLLVVVLSSVFVLVVFVVLFPFCGGFVALFCSPVEVAGGFASCVLVALYANVSESDSKSA